MSEADFQGLDWDLITATIPYIGIAIVAWYAGRRDAAAARCRAAGKALFVVIRSARVRGTYFSPFDLAVIEEARKALDD